MRHQSQEQAQAPMFITNVHGAEGAATDPPLQLIFTSDT